MFWNAFLRSIIDFFSKKAKVIFLQHIIMESLSLEKENTIKDIWNLFRLKRKTKAIKDWILRDIKNLFQYQGENYYKPVRIGNLWNNNFIEYENDGDRNKTLSVEEYLNKI